MAEPAATRRSLRAPTVALLAMLAWLGSAAAGPAKVYVADEEGNTVSVVDAATFARLTAIPVGRDHPKMS